MAQSHLEQCFGLVDNADGLQEKLFLQGIHVEDAYSDQPLGDLAGNVLCVTQCTNCLLVAFFGLTMCKTRAVAEAAAADAMGDLRWDNWLA